MVRVRPTPVEMGMDEEDRQIPQHKVLIGEFKKHKKQVAQNLAEEAKKKREKEEFMRKTFFEQLTSKNELENKEGPLSLKELKIESKFTDAGVFLSKGDQILKHMKQCVLSGRPQAGVVQKKPEKRP